MVEGGQAVGSVDGGQALGSVTRMMIWIVIACDGVC